MTTEEVHDSPVDWVNKHIQGYLDSGGKPGRRARPMLLLTTRGRRSGKLRRTAGPGRRGDFPRHRQHRLPRR